MTEGLAGEASIHDLRRALKYLRSLLVLIHPALGDARYRQDVGAVRAISKALAGPRQAGAMMEAAVKMKEAASLGAEAAAALAFEAAALRLGFEAEVLSLDRAALAKALHRLRKRIASWPLPPENPSLFIEGAGNALRRARRLIQKGLRARDMATLHKGRTALIHHLHHLRLLAAIGIPLNAQALPNLEKLRAVLGDLNDLDDAETLLGAAPGALTFTGDRKALGKLMRKRRRDLRAKAARLAEVLLAERPRSFERRLREAWTRSA